MKILNVGDLHLWDRELSTTRGFVENSDLMLDAIIAYVEADPEIRIVNFEGDIQHSTPATKSTLLRTATWKRKLEKLGNIMLERQPTMHIIQRAGVDPEKLYKQPLPLFTAEGNHDVSKTLRRVGADNKRIAIEDYTFFDDLLYSGVMQNPRGYLFRDLGKDYYIQFNNYGEATAPIPDAIANKENIIAIKILHDTVRFEDSPSWLNYLEDDVYEADDVLQDCRLAICGHIHEPLPPKMFVNTKGKNVVFVQTGAMARTSAVDKNIRDFGYCTLLDLKDGIDIVEVQLPIMPSDEYFDWSQIIINENKKQALKERKGFSLSFSEFQMSAYDPRQDIANMEIETDVKDNCIEVLDKIQGMDGV